MYIIHLNMNSAWGMSEDIFLWGGGGGELGQTYVADE